MKQLLAAATAFLAALGVSSPAAAWGAQGHQYVGNVAEALLNTNASAQVSLLLGPGVDLGAAAVWPDCIRDVAGPDAGPWNWTHTQYTPAACNPFGNNAVEKAAMEDYAGRNWTNCEYAHQLRKCNLAFHFADVADQHYRYDSSYFGTGDADVVGAIKAAILVLEGQPSPAPFKIKDKREALFLLAHFVGDVHQPLHVGAVYLDAAGKRVNPDTTPGDHRANETTGGNWLFFGSSNLHHDWDTITLGATPTDDAICQAGAVNAVAGALLDKPALWASESVLSARMDAFQSLSFTGAGPRKWKVAFQQRTAYVAHQRLVQQRQLLLAGARLAEVLNAVWPGTPPTLSCP